MAVSTWRQILFFIVVCDKGNMPDHVHCLPPPCLCRLFPAHWDGHGMALTGWDHAPFWLRHLIGDGDRGLSITVVVDTW
jgi:hypothetical protein